MLGVYVSDYILFTFLASLGILQIALSKKSRAKAAFGAAVLIASYFWFFTSRDRNIHTFLEGTQLFVIFAFSAASVVAVVRVFNFLARNK